MSTLLVLLLFVLGRVPDTAYAASAAPRVQYDEYGAYIRQNGYHTSHARKPASIRRQGYRTPRDKNQHPVTKTKSKHQRKLHHGKRFEVKCSAPEAPFALEPAFAEVPPRRFGLPPSYSYLFYEEINPPPPKLG